MSAHQIDWTSANRAQLGAAYEFLIGYNPFTDDPTNADDDVRAVLIEFAADYATPAERAELPNILRAAAEGGAA